MTLNYLYVSDSLSYIFNRDLFSVLWFYIFNCMLNPPVLQPSTLPYWVCIKALSPAIFSILRKLCPSGSSTKILWSYLWVISLWHFTSDMKNYFGCILQHIHSSIFSYHQQRCSLFFSPSSLTWVTTIAPQWVFLLFFFPFLQSLLNVAARVILLKHKFIHYMSQLKTFSGFLSFSEL